MTRLLVAFFLAGLGGCAFWPTNHDGSGAPRQAAIVPLQSERPLVALALGSGGARGFAHVGVIKALEEAGIVPDIVTGSSSGAVVAALYASGMSAAALEALALDVEQSDLVDFVLFRDGWIRGRALQDFVSSAVGRRPIERLAKPFAVVATAASDRRMTVFNRGDTGLAVRASVSVPNLFIPPVIHGEAYLDGGLTSPVPVKVARAMGADVVVAVDVSWFAQSRRVGGGMGRHGRGGRYALLAAELEEADVVVTPGTVPARMLDFEHKLANIAAGAAAGRAAVARVRQAIERAALAKRTAPATASVGKSLTREP